MDSTFTSSHRKPYPIRKNLRMSLVLGCATGVPCNDVVTRREYTDGWSTPAQRSGELRTLLHSYTTVQKNSNSDPNGAYLTKLFTENFAPEDQPPGRPAPDENSESEMLLELCFTLKFRATTRFMQIRNGKGGRSRQRQGVIPKTHTGRSTCIEPTREKRSVNDCVALIQMMGEKF